MGKERNPDFINDPFTAPNTPFFGKLILSNFSTSVSNTHLSVYSDDDDELLFAGYKAGNINFYKNFSNHVYDNLNPENEEYLDIDVGSNSAPAVADIDGDGYLEMLIGTKLGGLEFYNTDIKVKDGLSTYNPFSKGKIDIYPNPFKDEIMIDINDDSGKSINYSIYNTVGSLLIKNKLYKGNNKIKLNMLRNGVYFIKVSSETNYKTFKIIKSN
ncbi:MAG TPA: T9SS type A sorting domain-containing protein [Bacteroidetes bacterium]|nr:T9SS type A sorting domain-containing protein [Bacteroidota bacterium]